VASWSPRDRLLAAWSGKPADHVPCSFMIFGALRRQSRTPEEYVTRQLELGLDAFVEIPPRSPLLLRPETISYDLYGLPVRLHPQARVTDVLEPGSGGRPLVRRTYDLPSGSLTTAVEVTEDWPHGQSIPLFDDYIIPRGRKRLVATRDDLKVLRELLGDPTTDDLKTFRADAARMKAFAADKGLATVGEWGVLFDAANWLCGMEELAERAIEDPECVEELLDVIGTWNLKREALLLEAGVDLLVRRAWYETVDFLSPTSYRRFVLPWLKREVKQAHEAGAKLACITTSAYTPLLGDYLDAGIDVLIGQDPVQDPRADFVLTKRTLGGKVGLWGGVNGFVTVEQGTPSQVETAVEYAIRSLGSGGGFVLSPVDNVREDSELAMRNVETFIRAWKAVR